MKPFRQRLISPLTSRIKRRLAGEDISALASRRARKRLRWIAAASDDPIVRFRALRNLAELLDPEAVSLFLEVGNAEAGSLAPALGRTAAEGLGRLHHGDGAVLLRRLLDPYRPATVQLAAARALATIGREEDWEALRSWSARADQTSALFPDSRDCVPCEGDQPSGTAPLVWVLETVYADKAARWWSSKAGKWLAGEDKKPRMDADRGADKIVAAAHRHALERGKLSPEDFRKTVLHLGSLARDRDFDLLVDLLQRQTEEERRSAVIQALGLHGDPRAIPMFVKWLGEVPDSQPDLAADLLRAAGRLGWPQLSPEILRLWERYTAPQVRLNLLSALGDSGGDQAVRFLLDRVRQPGQDLSESEFEWAARSLRRCGVIGREAIRGAVAMARAGGGERARVAKLAELAGVH
jgi:HEAT repeat protein